MTGYNEILFQKNTILGALGFVWSEINCKIIVEKVKKEKERRRKQRRTKGTLNMSDGGAGLVVIRDGVAVVLTGVEDVHHRNH